MKLYKEYDKESIRAVIESGRKRDLHMHTCFSDGELTPKQLIDLRMSEGFEMLAITDHDTDEGSWIGSAYAEFAEVCYLSGIELDSEDPLGKDIHVLGYGFDYDNQVFASRLLNIRIKRARRNDKMMAALNEMGYEVTLEDIGTVNEGRYVGKPTFATILYNKGYMGNPNEAFGTLFREEKIKSIKKETLATRDAVDLIHAGGGLAVMAHPMEQRKNDESFRDYQPRMYKLLDRMREYGIDGIECYHPSASPEQSRLLAEYADMYGLMITEGSDVHSVVHARDYSRYHRP